MTIQAHPPNDPIMKAQQTVQALHRPTSLWQQLGPQGQQRLAQMLARLIQRRQQSQTSQENSHHDG